MAAYVIAIVDVKDAARYDREYVPGVLPLIEKHGGKPLVVSPEVDTKEGRWPPGRTIIIEFPDQAAAEAWYSDEAYQPLLKLRGEISEGLLAIAEGL
jgi:uncharacterized protein (DUF1330 family)